MKVLFYITYAEWSPMLACEMELIKQHQADGDEVYVVKCGNVLEICHATKTYKDKETCLLCQSKLHGLLRTINLAPDCIFDLQKLPKLAQISIPDFKTVEELKQYCYEGVDIGMGVASTMISGLRDHDFNPAEHREAVLMNVRTSLNVYLFFKQFIQDKRPEKVYMFNGRFAEIKPLLRLCQKENIAYCTYEGGSAFSRYDLYPNTIPHDFATIALRSKGYWYDGENTEYKKEVAREWFARRRSGIEAELDPSYVKEQSQGLLPKRFDRNKVNVAIFNTSEDELAAIDVTFDDKQYRDQNDALRQVATLFREWPEFHFYLRVHPNLGKLRNSQIKQIETFDHPNLTVIKAEDPVDSYSLLDACDVVLTFCSTMGIEATFWGKPSILWGNAFYKGLDAVYEADSLQAVCDLLRAPGLPPKGQVAAMMYGYWMATRGQELVIFKDLATKSGIYSDKYEGYDRYGKTYRKVTDGLLKIRYPITYIPFRKRILEYLTRKSVAEFYNRS